MRFSVPYVVELPPNVDKILAGGVSSLFGNFAYDIAEQKRLSSHYLL